MALKLATTFKGAPSEYWRINVFTYDDVNDTAIVHLWLYVNEESKNDNIKANGLKREILNLTEIKNIIIPEELQVINNPRDLLKTMLYAKIKESKLDEDGNETNPFVLAEDV